MQKTLIRRSQFIAIALLATQAYVDVPIEADEAYIIVPNSSGSAIRVQRKREKDLATFLAANPTFTAGNTQTYGVVTTTYGRVPLDAPIDPTGNMYNKQVTTTAADTTQQERSANHNLGFKEIISVASNTAAAGQVIIELINYVTADFINA